MWRAKDTEAWGRSVMPFSSMKPCEVKGSLTDQQADWLGMQALGFDDPFTYFPAMDSGSAVVSAHLIKTEQGVVARCLLECAHYTRIRSSNEHSIVSLIRNGFLARCKKCDGAA